MVERYFKESARLYSSILTNTDFLRRITEAVELVVMCYESGKKLLVAGNGGSAADAQHFAAEFVGRYKRERKAYPAIALTTDTSILTAWSNDYEFASVFARQIEAHAQSGDVFIGISTSGNSKNVTQAVEKAKAMGVKTICLLGKGGGEVMNRADLSIVVPSDNTPRIQEVHTTILHIISEEVEQKLSRV
ncbi:MAG: D-sedoheptulose 7-phosphate isomerase [Candidatus Kerfeldbacteria bacterium]|nr:D-sedoheptulose 7-phosphate isomerase [Candidatus Kerfeldbacteria bacterium]